MAETPERDWERDWEICKKATPGPWRNKVWYCKTRVLNDGKCCFCGNANGVLVHEETDSEGERYHIHEFPDSDWRTIWSVSKFCRVVGTYDYEEGGVCTSEDDALFVAEARTGWPAALEERARLEKRVRELEDRVKFLTANVVALQENYVLFRKIIQRIQAICSIYEIHEWPEIEAEPFIRELNKLLEEWENAPIEL